MQSEPAYLREARPGDAEAITDVAIRSKAHWGYSRDFMEACRAELTVTPEQIRSERFRFVVAEPGPPGPDSRRPVCGYYAIENGEGQTLELEALFVDPDHLRRGIGTLLLEHATASARDMNGERLVIQADPNAADFYANAGAEPIGTRESGSIPGRYLPLFAIDLSSSMR